MSNDKIKTRFTFFFPGARVLSATEISGLTPEKKKAAETTGQEGLWLEIDCPDAACVDSEGRVMIPAAGSEERGGKGTWLNLFCPEDSCEIQQSSDLA